MAYGNTNAQVIASSKLVEFNQLWNYESMVASSNFTKGTNGVINILSTSTFETDTQVDITITSGHKYFFKIVSDCNCGVEIYKSGVTSQNIYADTIYDSSISDTLSIYIRRQTSPTPTGTLSFFIIDLTTMGLDDLTLAECQALFNAPYYAYTSGTNMQLIYDGVKPIALADLPAQDFIVEQGTSGIWGYRKWNSGVAECWTKTPIIKAMTPNVAWGSLFNTGADTIGAQAFPFEFISKPNESAKMTCGQGGWQNWENAPTTTTSGSYQWIRPTAGGTASANLYLYEIGYWK